MLVLPWRVGAPPTENPGSAPDLMLQTVITKLLNNRILKMG